MRLVNAPVKTPPPSPGWWDAAASVQLWQCVEIRCVHVARVELLCWRARLKHPGRAVELQLFGSLGPAAHEINRAAACGMGLQLGTCGIPGLSKLGGPPWQVVGLPCAWRIGCELMWCFLGGGGSMSQHVGCDCERAQTLQATASQFTEFNPQPT